MKRQNMMRTATSLSVAAILGLLAISGGCGSEKASSPTQSGDSPYVIDSLTASPNFLQPGDSTYIYVGVQMKGDDSEPAVGVSVQFGWIGRNTTGEFFVSEALTDSLGVAYGGYRAPETAAGTINLKVVVGDKEVGYLAVDVATGPSDPPTGTPSIQITSTESSLPANGTSTTELTITVTRGGQPASGEVITLVAGERFEDRDYDGMYSSGDSILVDIDSDGFWDTIGNIPGSVVTGSSGNAVATYTAGLVECSAFIKATVDSVSSDLEILLSGGPADITLNVSPVELLANGYTTSSVVAAILDGEGRPLPGRLVRFVAGESFQDIDGDGYYTPGVDSFTDANDNGVWDVMGQLTPSSANSNGEGLAEAVFVAGRTTGQVTVYASTQEKRGEAIISLLELPRVVGATWSWNPESIYADGSSVAVLELVVLDINGGTIPGKEITFTASAGSIDTVAVADADGVASTTFIASELCETVTVTASAGDWSLDIPLELTPLPEVCAIQLDMESERLSANGAGGQVWTTGLAAQCYDGDGLPIPQGVAVTFEIVSGPGGGEGFAPLGESAVTVRTDTDGIAAVVIAAGNKAGIVEILVSSGAAERSTTLQILETVRQISFQALPPELWIYGVGMVDHCVLEATCYLAHELLAPAGIEVTFILISGPGGGETLLDEEGSV
ncbi:MAG: Ig-like domain-containing protein, partial [Candidatus Eisenbacteria sp.]|nr:Ig-like domain-containing protein [Candidatus Eisenbacteria bacterium]